MTPMDIDEIFEKLENKQVEDKKSNVEEKKSNVEDKKSNVEDKKSNVEEKKSNVVEKKKKSINRNVVSTDSGDSKYITNKESRKYIDGLPVYSLEELNIGQGGDTEDCPFECDCCY